MQKIKFTVSIVGTLIMFYVMATTGKPLITSTTPLGILNLEFAYNQQMVEQILNAWKNLIDTALINTYWDFLYLFFYAFLLVNICTLIHHRLRATYGKIGLLFGRLAILAAFLDVIENGFMLNVLNNSYNAMSLQLMVGASVLKWIIVLIVVLYSLVGLILLTIRSLFPS
ncbi:MAG: hypothetical protein V4663_17465 [Bacteroidota bacterium]